MGILVLFIIIVAAGGLAYSYYRNRGGRRLFSHEHDDAIDLAKQRYANGEISREEFEQIKQDLQDLQDDEGTS
jgi:putative membrane protein